MKFESVMSSLVSGQVDIVVGGMTVTEERKEMVLFSPPVFDGGTVVVMKTPEAGDEAATTDSLGFFDSLKLSFEKTFVRESRWKLVANGIGVTIFISILSAVFGTVLGFLICLMRLSRNKVADGIAITYIRILQGTPMVVLLMILFYVVFARTGLDGVWVAIIGFGMNFAAYVSEMMRTGIQAVDKGQMEAALALGYTKPRAFFKIVFPQAARHFLPVYQGEFISLVKMTSVVGYIAIHDLTKASDIIRSRTYEAFFPLVTTAIIYFIIAWVLTRVLTAIQRRLEPKNSTL
jgi:polar amino acid transport system substrate-binding protein